MENATNSFSTSNQKSLPNATAVLVLGIISIVGCFCYGILGIICGIIALILASKDSKVFNLSPESYTEASLKNLKAGKTCAIIGLALSAIYLIFVIIMFTIYGSLLATLPWQNLNNIK